MNRSWLRRPFRSVDATAAVLCIPVLITWPQLNFTRLYFLEGGVVCVILAFLGTGVAMSGWFGLIGPFLSSSGLAVLLLVLVVQLWGAQPAGTLVAAYLSLTLALFLGLAFAGWLSYFR